MSKIIKVDQDSSDFPDSFSQPKNQIFIDFFQLDSQSEEWCLILLCIVT